MPVIRPIPALIALNLLTLGALVWSNAQSQARNSTQDHVRARVIDLVNARGEVRAQLYVQDNGGGVAARADCVDHDRFDDRRRPVCRRCQALCVTDRSGRDQTFAPGTDKF